MSRQKNLKRNLLICLLAGSAVMYTLPLHAATSVVANNALPENGHFVNDKLGTILKNPNNSLEMNITQSVNNAVITWDKFDVGGSATVNFKGPESGYNTLNYVNAGGSMSQIYGTINANNSGNIFIVNPAGVQIGNSAQINVGSLYVSNKTFSDDLLKTVNDTTVMNEFMKNGTANADAALMSLGNINANKVTFEGNGRIVIDSERITNDANNATFRVNTNDAGNVLIGYDAYEETFNGTQANSYKGKDKIFSNVYENGSDTATDVKGYMWVEDVEQLQAINTNLGGNYALRNSIDATSTSGWSDSEHDTNNEGFLSIGIDDNGKVAETNINNETKYGFYGNFDGIDYNIFGLTINREDTNNVGLFGVTHNANISNVTLVGGSITGQSVVGSVVGAALGSTHITNATNSASVTGTTDVGGIVGASRNERISDGNNGTISVDTNAVFTDLVNTGTIKGTDFNDNVTDTSISNTGGLIGYMYNGTLKGNSYNLGDVSSEGHNVGGLVGHAVNSTIGNPSVVDGKPVENVQVVYNRLDVEGAYNVGGIVGNMEGTTVQNAENSGNVTASGYTNGTYTFHTDNTKDNYSDGVSKTVDVNVSNVGGIAGVSSYYQDNNGNKHDNNITDVLNIGSVSSSQAESGKYYNAGNVGGIVGSAVDTNITNATNRENEVRGAHNVGGVAGYFGSTKGDSTDKDTPHYTVTNGINDGGDIMATGARNKDGFVKEKVRSTDTGAEETIIGNMGGVVGYLDGDNVYVTGSANRGTVHSLDITGNTVSQASQASNTGGVVGKIDRSDTKTLSEIENNIKNAAVSNSYNTGDVRGYMGVGGVVGMMYNGEVAGSYNLGSINTTRRATDAASNAYPSVNMGGVVGDTTEQTTAKALIYDVYNKGQIGDETYNYYARHVGGIVGRLSGDVEKAYNTGAIYNGYNVVGGIAGWFYTGSINNSFNTGNITVINNDTTAGSQVGGIVGGVGLYSDTKGSTDSKISNAYNLGTIRSFAVKNGDGSYTTNQIGGIIGFIMGNEGHNLTVENVYTTGNLYAGRLNEGKNNSGLGSIIGVNSAGGGRVTVTNAYYISPKDGLVFTDLTKTGQNNATGSKVFGEKWTGTEFNNGITNPNKTTGVVEDEKYAWRIYDGNTPILNAFLPDSEKYFENGLKDNTGAFTGTIQYGTAYDPLLTIINTDRDLVFNFGTKDNELSITNAAGLAVYGGGVTLNNFTTSSGSGYFGGTIYADGALNLNGGINDIGLGSAADIYGSAVNITTDGKVTIYGDVTATGNGTKEGDNPNTNGSITITAGDVDVYGTLTSASNTQGATVTIPGIEDTVVTNWTPGDINNPYASMVDIADRFAHTTGVSAVDGNINITAGTNAAGENIGDGNVNLYFGNKEQGLITTGGNLTVTGTGDVYVDSDLDIGGDMTLTSTGADSEVLLTLTNIGKVQADRFTNVIESAINGKDLNSLTAEEIVYAVKKAYPDLAFDEEQAGYIITALKQGNNKVDAVEKLNNDIAVAYMHDFMHSFAKETQNKIALNAASGDAKLTVDMWVENTNGSGQFNFEKYDTTFPGTKDKHTFKEELNNLNFAINGDMGNASESVYVEVSAGEQLKAIQNAGNKALGYNYALMGDINASDVEDYVAIGTGNVNAEGNEIGFTGTFDGRGNRIIGLTVDGKDTANAGIFDTIGTNGVVKDVNIYSGNFTGTTNAGAVAGENNGRIEGIVTFGNTVTVNGKDGKAGGIVGVNNSGEFKDDANDGELTGGIYDVESTGSVIAGSSSAVAGGLVGTNNGGLANSFSDSAVTVATGVTLDKDTTALGGVVGINNGNVQYVDSLGVTNGGATGSSNIGGIIGINNGNMYSGYNESIVSGKDKVGGIIGENSTGGTVTNIVNATSVTGENVSADNVSQYVGGLVGSNSGSVTNGRNNGTITGTNYVGGMVGNNAQRATLTNLVNDSSAEILGENYVGGIAGSNAGKITADKENDNLVNRGSITGNKFVGGVAGVNEFGGTIANTLNSVVLHAKGENAQYFGGVVGQNSGEINGATNTSNIDITAVGGSYVGGIIGQNTKSGTLKGEIRNEGSVAGKSQVGGIIGENDNDYVLIGTEGNRLTVENDGSVDAQEGGAAGIFYENHGEIKYADISNSGVVNGGDKEGGTGGLFGINTGNITESTLINSGTVIGGGIVGGLIGKNSGDAFNSSLTNTGSVIGKSDVGGLIGYNTGTVTGGRNKAQETDKDGKITAEKDSYYKYQIYNNGVVNVGTWNDKNSNGKVDDGEITGLQQGETSQNIGGLIGNNADEIATGGKKGSLTAGYNTGVINASGSTTVGGIAGSNSGTIDQVFNTVMTENGQNQTITGDTNVGGLVGNNSGILSNAYNTTSEVKGNAASTGNLVGTNSGRVQYVYGVANDLIGSGTGSIKNYHVIDGSDKWLQEGTYEDFKFGANGWKIYDGSTLPMLSVFLTKVTVVDQHLVNQYFSAKHYGELHQITADDIKALIAIGAISAPDGFGAFNNNNGLIQGVADDAMANSGNWLYSQQILGSNINGLFNPNNLGYDISLVYSPFELDNDPSSHWNYLFNDAPFDRNKDFRERKAEVNFVDGGMEI